MSNPFPGYPGPEETVDYLGFSPSTPQRMRVAGEGPPTSRSPDR